MVMYALHDAMLKPLPGNMATPCVAESFTAAEDSLTYDFVIRQGVKFHNGEPVTAEDVKFSFERYRGTSHDLLQNRVAAVETPDPLHDSFKLNKPWPDFLTFYASATGAGWIVPKKYVEKVGDDGFKKAPVGAGPYKFVSFTPGVELVMDAFDEYWRKAPSVKRIVFKVIPDEATRLAALKRGEIDIAYSIRGELADELQKTPGLTLKAPVPGSQWLYFADQWDPKSPWHDERLRRAANLAMDRKGINQALTLGRSHLTNSIIPESFEFYWQPPLPVYYPAKAKELLAEAGHPNGFDAGEFFCDASYSNVAEALLNNFAEVGIKSRLRPLERAAFFKAYAEKSLKNIIFGGSGAFGNTATRNGSVLRQGRRLCLWQLPRHRRAVPAAGGRARPQKTRGNPREDAAARLRQVDLCADLALGLPQWHRTASRRVRFRADPRLRLHRTLRRHHVERRVIRRGEDSGIPDLWSDGFPMKGQSGFHEVRLRAVRTGSNRGIARTPAGTLQLAQ